MAIVAAVAVLGFSAFGLSKNSTRLVDNWYYTDASGYLQPLANVPSGDCNPELTSGTECAVQTHNPISSPTLRSALTPSQIKDQAFSDED